MLQFTLLAHSVSRTALCLLTDFPFRVADVQPIVLPAHIDGKTLLSYETRTYAAKHIFTGQKLGQQWHASALPFMIKLIIKRRESKV